MDYQTYSSHTNQCPAMSLTVISTEVIVASLRFLVLTADTPASGPLHRLNSLLHFSSNNHRKMSLETRYVLHQEMQSISELVPGISEKLIETPAMKTWWQASGWGYPDYKETRGRIFLAF